MLQFYAVSTHAYSSMAADEFEDEVLPRLHQWVRDRINRPAAAIRRHEMLIVEWTGSEHREHSLRHG